MDNIEFYVSACNWCGLIQREVSRARKQSLSVVEESEPVEKTEEACNIVSADGYIVVTIHNVYLFRYLYFLSSKPRNAGRIGQHSIDDANIAQYEAALKVNPSDYETYIKLAGLYLDRGEDGDFDRAIEYAELALRINHNNVWALFIRGVAKSEKNENAEALSDLNAVLQTDKVSKKGVYYIIGKIHFKERYYQGALEAFEEVKSIDPKFANIDKVLEHVRKLA